MEKKEQVERDYGINENRSTSNACSEEVNNEYIEIPDALDRMDQFENDEESDDLMIRIRKELN